MWEPKAGEVGAHRTWTRDRGVVAMSLGTLRAQAATPWFGCAHQSGVTAGRKAQRVLPIRGYRGGLVLSCNMSLELLPLGSS